MEVTRAIRATEASDSEPTLPRIKMLFLKMNPQVSYTLSVARRSELMIQAKNNGQACCCRLLVSMAYNSQQSCVFRGPILAWLPLRPANDSSPSNAMTNGHAGCFTISKSKVHLRGETFQCSTSSVRMVGIARE